MHVPSRRSVRHTLSIALGAAAVLALAPSLPAQSRGCDPIYAAQRKLLATPHHALTVDSAGTDKMLHKGAPTASEQVAVNGTIYILYNGKWKRSIMTVDAMRKQEEENIKDSKSTCKLLRSENVNGQSAVVYSVHSESDMGASDGLEWISKSSGLPLRSTITVDVGGGAAGASHMTTNYDYANIHAPAGVQ